jgi:hypothetical protein
VISHVAYQLDLPPQWKIHNVFHAAYLSPYKEMEEHGPNFPEPPPDLIEGEKEYEVEHIVDMGAIRSFNTRSDGKVTPKHTTHGNPLTIFTLQNSLKNITGKLGPSSEQFV